MADQQPKLYTKKTFAIAFTAILIGACLGCYREFRDTGAVSETRVVVSAVVLVIGTVSVVLVGRYANKPEK
jgi:hypothetical protein